MSTPEALLRDLARTGVATSDVWQLVNSQIDYRAAIPVLLDWLENLEARVRVEDRESLREALVRALTVPAARPAAAPIMIDQFRRVFDASGLGTRWIIGNALEVVADDSVFEDLESIANNHAYGKARQMVVLGLGRSRDARAVPLLIELLDDDDVSSHAAMALGRLKAPEARLALEQRLTSSHPLLRREAKKALAKLSDSRD